MSLLIKDQMLQGTQYDQPLACDQDHHRNIPARSAISPVGDQVAIQRQKDYGSEGWGFDSLRAR